MCGADFYVEHCIAGSRNSDTYYFYQKSTFP